VSRLSLFLLAALLFTPVSAADKNKEKDSGISRQQADAILAELKAIHELLLRSANPQNAPDPVVHAKLKLDKGESLGSKTAPITMVEFTDYQCPFCRQFHMTTFEEIRKKYIDTGKVRFVSLDMPLDFHPNALKAAQAAHCAADQGQFWKMRDTLSANAAKLENEDLLGYAQGMFLNMTVFKKCLDSEKHKEAVLDSQRTASALNVSGTPSFLIGKTTAEGVDGVIFVGAQPLAAFEAKLKEFESEK
jgi:protein-disulfide isomerase